MILNHALPVSDQSGRKITDPPGLREACLCDDLQIVDALADGNAEQMRVDDAGERKSLSLAAACFGEVIIVASEQSAAQIIRSIEKLGYRSSRPRRPPMR
jgi:hypothetical protein